MKFQAPILNYRKVPYRRRASIKFFEFRSALLFKNFNILCSKIYLKSFFSALLFKLCLYFRASIWNFTVCAEIIFSKIIALTNIGWCQRSYGHVSECVFFNVLLFTFIYDWIGTKIIVISLSIWLGYGYFFYRICFAIEKLDTFRLTPWNPCQKLNR